MVAYLAVIGNLRSRALEKYALSSFVVFCKSCAISPWRSTIFLTASANVCRPSAASKTCFQMMFSKLTSAVGRFRWRSTTRYCQSTISQAYPGYDVVTITSIMTAPVRN